MKFDRDIQKFNIRANPPKSIRLNKSLVFLIFGIVLFLINFAVVQAFSDSGSSNKQVPDAVKAKVSDDDSAQKVQNEIQKLPVSYENMSDVKEYLHKAFGNNVPVSVQNELQSLRSQQAMLERQLANLHRVPTYGANDMHAKQALSSGLFFPGVSPPAQQSMGIKQTVIKNAESKNIINGRGNSHASISAYEKQNMQYDKVNFLKTSADEQDDQSQIYNQHSLINLASPYEVQAGTIIPATLLTAIDTSLPGDIVAQIRQNIYDTVSGKYLLIPQGSKLLGEYQAKISYGQTRVLIVFTRVIRSDGSSILLSKLSGVDAKGQSGMSGVVDNHWSRVLGAAVLSTLLSIGTGVTADNVDNNNAYYRGAVSGGVIAGAQNISQIGQNITNRAMNIQPTLKIPMGYQFNIIVNKDMVLKPYRVL